MREEQKKNTGISTGFKELDYLTSGLQKGELIIVGGRPSMGKTSFALSISRNIATKESGRVLIFSLEMSKEQMTDRILLMDSHAKGKSIRSGDTSDSECERPINSEASVENMDILIDDTPGITIDEIRKKSNEICKENSLSLIVIDYLQLMSDTGEFESRQQEVAKISRELKDLAKELDVPIIVLSQLSRIIDQRENHRPQLSDLRESGATEQDADIIMFLYRDDYYNNDSEYRNIAEVIIAKQQKGECGRIYLKWNSESAEFTDYD